MTDSAHDALYRMEDERRRLVVESEQIQLRLGRLRPARRRRYRRGDPRNDRTLEGLANRAALLEHLARINEQLRTVNKGIKEERRRLTAMLAEGSPRPRTAQQYVVALYRLFDEAVPPDQRSDEERALMRRARDFVIAGMHAHE